MCNYHLQMLTITSETLNTFGFVVIYFHYLFIHLLLLLFIYFCHKVTSGRSLPVLQSTSTVEEINKNLWILLSNKRTDFKSSGIIK